MKQTMLKLLMFYSILDFQPKSCFGQIIGKSDSCFCNNNCWPILNKLQDSFTEVQMTLFLRSFSKECKNNAEFSEFGNETLFFVLNKNTGLFIQVFDKQYSNLDHDYILMELREPLLENVNVNDLIKKVNMVSGHKTGKDNILRSLKFSSK